MGALFLDDCGASCMCKTNTPATCPNPRGWNYLGCHGQPSQAPCNVTTPEGIAHFEQATRGFVSAAVARCVRLQCRSLMFWSIEGSEWKDITYAGSPDLLPVLAPEMDNVEKVAIPPAAATVVAPPSVPPEPEMCAMETVTSSSAYGPPVTSVLPEL